MIDELVDRVHMELVNEFSATKSYLQEGKHLHNSQFRSVHLLQTSVVLNLALCSENPRPSILRHDGCQTPEGHVGLARPRGGGTCGGTWGLPVLLQLHRPQRNQKRKELEEEPQVEHHCFTQVILHSKNISIK